MSGGGAFESMVSAVSTSGTRTLMGMFSGKRLKKLLPCKPLADALKDVRSQCAGLNNFNGEYACENVSARWVVEAKERQPEDPIIVYFHGGGYVLDILFPEVTFIVSLYQQLANPRLSVLMLDYSTAPTHQYPVAIREASDLYRQLTEVDLCTNIILLGDSAGGNLALTLTAHYHYTHPAIPSLSSSTAPKALVLISPWLNLIPEHKGSYEKNENKDCMTHAILERWAKLYAPSDEDRASMWCSPLHAAPEIWKDCLPEQTLMLWGQNEVTFDDLQQFASKLDLKHTEIEPNGVHDSIMFPMPRLFTSLKLTGDRMSNKIFSRIVSYLNDIM
jgi:acetyl esterase/lipase